MKKYWKIILPISIGFAALSLHFLPIKSAKDPGLIFNMLEVLGKKLTDEKIIAYSQFMGPFVKKSKGAYFPDINGEIYVYDFKSGRIETLNGMVYGTWYLFKSNFAKFNGFKPDKSPVSGMETALKTFGFPAENRNFNSVDRAFIWENEFNIRQVQLYREPSGGNFIVSVQAYLIIPWEGMGNFHQGSPKDQKNRPGKETPEGTLM